MTVTTGQTVRWEFDEAATTHTITSTSSNWSVDQTRSPNGAAVEHTFDQPGTYTFHCTIHPAMTGTVTVSAAADALEKVLVFSKTAGFRHDSIPAGIAAIQQLGQQNDFAVDTTEDSAQFNDANLAQYDAVVFLSTTGDVLTTPSRPRSSATSAPAAATSASTRRPTPSTAGTGTATWSAPSSATTPPERPRRRSTSSTRRSRPRSGLPARWTRTDEWYNYQGPIDPAVNGAAAPTTARASDVHVLATVDESTYGEDDGNTADDDHPIAWCSDYDGGRIWYTGMGHTIESYSRRGLPRAHARRHGDRDRATRRPTAATAARGPADRSDFEKVTLDDDTQNPMELDVAPDGRVFYIERDGRRADLEPDHRADGHSRHASRSRRARRTACSASSWRPTSTTSHWVYLFYSALPDPPGNQIVVALQGRRQHARPGVAAADPARGTHQRAECCHSSGSLVLRRRRQPLHLHRRQHQPVRVRRLRADRRARPAARSGTPSARRPTRTTSNGKILRIKPLANPSGAPGVGTTYTIPAGNLFPAGHGEQTRPEIYAHGLPQPVPHHRRPGDRLGAAGRLRPGRRLDRREPRPAGQRRVQRASTSAGNYGWPYCIRHNVPYNDYDFATGTSGPKFNCAAPVNNSPNNTGLTNLPPASAADDVGWATPRPTPRFPELGTRRRPDGRPALPLRRRPTRPRPSSREFYDGKWFIGEWNNGWIKTATLDARRRADVDVPVRRRGRLSHAPRHGATSARWTSSSGPTARCT